MAPRSPAQSVSIPRNPAAIVSTSQWTTTSAPTRSMSRQMVTLPPIGAGLPSAIASATALIKGTDDELRSRETAFDCFRAKRSEIESEAPFILSRCLQDGARPTGAFEEDR
jgi:hypothetical protein